MKSPGNNMNANPPSERTIAGVTFLCALTGLLFASPFALPGIFPDWVSVPAVVFAATTGVIALGSGIQYMVLRRRERVRRFEPDVVAGGAGNREPASQALST